MSARFDNIEGLDSYRVEGNAGFKSVAKVAKLMALKKGAGKKQANEPIHAALGVDLDEDITALSSEGGLVRNRALLHYMATLSTSNSETDKFNYDFVQSLLDGGANINEAVDVYGQTIFHEVARSWNLDVAAFLVRNGGDVDQQDKYGRSPLHVSAAADHGDMVEFLLHNGANLDSRSKGDEQTPLHLAAKNDAALSLQALLGFGANIDSLDSRGRTPFQVATELSRSVTARILIEEGASSCIYDANGSSAMTVLTEKLPDLALEALDQLHVSDTITRRELFYLNLLEESRQKKDTKKARTPLETAVVGRRFDVLMHPVMQRLIDLKWQQYGKFGTILDLVINLFYAILFTAFAISTPAVGEELYLPLKSKGWRLFIGLVLILMTAYQMYLQIKTTFKSREKQKSWIKWRLQQLKADLQYCHPKWQEEEHIREEMKLTKDLPLLSTIDAWFFFDWFIIIVILITIALNLSYFFVGSSSVKVAYLRVLSILVILVWLRIMKYLRPFPGIGTLVLILGATGGDFVNWGFFFLLLFVPFTSCFWIIFGGLSPQPVEHFSKVPGVVYTMVQISVGEDFNLDGLVAADPVMARLLSALYITVMVIVCLNILIAYLSNTFTLVYSNAVENTSMQRAINILNIEKFLTKQRKEKYFRYIREYASPEAVQSSTIDMTEKRLVKKNAEQVQKDFKKTHDILRQRFKKGLGRGKKSAFDVLLRDVQKLRRHQNDTVNDLQKIQTDLGHLGNLLFGNSSQILQHLREDAALALRSEKNVLQTKQPGRAQDRRREDDVSGSSRDDTNLVGGNIEVTPRLKEAEVRELKKGFTPMEKMSESSERLDTDEESSERADETLEKKDDSLDKKDDSVKDDQDPRRGSMNVKRKISGILSRVSFFKGKEKEKKNPSSTKNISFGKGHADDESQGSDEEEFQPPPPEQDPKEKQVLVHRSSEEANQARDIVPSPGQAPGSNGEQTPYRGPDQGVYPQPSQGVHQGPVHGGYRRPNQPQSEQEYPPQQRPFDGHYQNPNQAPWQPYAQGVSPPQSYPPTHPPPTGGLNGRADMGRYPLVPYAMPGNRGYSNTGFADDSHGQENWESWEKISVDSISL